MNVPIACTLSSDELRDRRALWERIDADVVSKHRHDQGFEIVYAATPEVERVLPSLVDAETRCCGFASWRLARDAGNVVLHVSGPADGVTSLAEQFGIT